jgi:RHS repeat-associated protein
MNKHALYLITLLGLCLTQPMAHAMSVQWTDYGYDNNGNVSEKPRRFVGVLDRSEATCPAGVSSREAAANQLYDGDSGEIVGQYEYDPYGNTIKMEGQAAQENKIRFSTKEYDSSTGLYYYGYRYYDPVTGRWPSRDPLGEYGGLNIYGFVNNDGVNQVDHLGQYIICSPFVPTFDTKTTRTGKQDWGRGGAGYTVNTLLNDILTIGGIRSNTVSLIDFFAGGGQKCFYKAEVNVERKWQKGCCDFSGGSWNVDQWRFSKSDWERVFFDCARIGRDIFPSI